MFRVTADTAVLVVTRVTAAIRVIPDILVLKARPGLPERAGTVGSVDYQVTVGSVGYQGTVVTLVLVSPVIVGTLVLEFRVTADIRERDFPGIQDFVD